MSVRLTLVLACTLLAVGFACWELRPPRSWGNPKIGTMTQERLRAELEGKFKDRGPKGPVWVVVRRWATQVLQVTPRRHGVRRTVVRLPIAGDWVISGI